MRGNMKLGDETAVNEPCDTPVLVTNNSHYEYPRHSNVDRQVIDATGQVWYDITRQIIFSITIKVSL